jgi:hypothetical protein
VAIIKSKKRVHCFFCGAEVFWSDKCISEHSGKYIPVNADESHHFCSAYASLRAERRKGPERTFFGK